MQLIHITMGAERASPGASAQCQSWGMEAQSLQLIPYLQSACPSSKVDNPSWKVSWALSSLDISWHLLASWQSPTMYISASCVSTCLHRDQSFWKWTLNILSLFTKPFSVHTSLGMQFTQYTGIMHVDLKVNIIGPITEPCNDYTSVEVQCLCCSAVPISKVI